MHVSPLVKFIIAIVVVAILILAIGLLQNVVIYPQINKHWATSMNDKLASYDGDVATIGVVVPCYGLTDDTATQVRGILKSAACAARVVVVVVNFNSVPDASAPTSVLHLLAEDLAFRGIADSFVLAEHVIEIEGVPHAVGDCVAFAMGYQELMRLSSRPKYVCYMAAHTAAVSQWDEVAVDQMVTTAVTERTILSYAVTSQDMMFPTFAVVGAPKHQPADVARGRLSPLVIAWQAFKEAPPSPHLALHMSTDFVFMSASPQLTPEVVSVLQSFKCPPTIAVMLMTVILERDGFKIMHPSKLVVNGRHSTNTMRLVAHMRQSGSPAQRFNEASTNETWQLLRSEPWQGHLATKGVFVSSMSTNYHAAMGLLPPHVTMTDAMSSLDVQVKYGSSATLLSAWTAASKRIAVHTDGDVAR